MALDRSEFGANEEPNCGVPRGHSRSGTRLWSSGLNEEEQEEKRRGNETHDNSLFNDGGNLGRARGGLDFQVRGVGRESALSRCKVRYASCEIWRVEAEMMLCGRRKRTGGGR